MNDTDPRLPQAELRKHLAKAHLLNGDPTVQQKVLASKSAKVFLQELRLADSNAGESA